VALELPRRGFLIPHARTNRPERVANPVKVYEYASCSTCKKAVKFLVENDIPFEKVGIVEVPPGIPELRRMLSYVGGDLRKLFNTSGQVYREMKLGERLSGMSDEEGLALLAGNGKLIKRPFVLSATQGFVGFKEEEWKRLR